jgi:gluconolactonase
MYICNNGGFSWAPGPRGNIMPGGPSLSEYIGGSLQRVDLQSGKVETLFTQCGERKLKGPNDLVFDKDGGIWFTDLGKRRAHDLDVGAVYYMKRGATELVEAVPHMLPANGIGLSPDEDCLCRRTPTARLWAFSVGATGQIVPRADLSWRNGQADFGSRRLPDV